MSRTIATILNLRDLFSPTLRETVNNTKEFQRQIQHTQNDITKFRDSVSNSFGSVKAKVAGVVAGLGIAEFAKQSVTLASDLVEVQNVVDTTFGSGAAQINAWSKTALNAFGLNQLQAKQFTGYLGAMMKSSGITGSALTKMSENLVGLAGDMASFDNLDPELAFEKIRSGISGETEPLKEIGINMDVTNLKAYALSQGIKKSYDSMSQAEQVTLRYNYLMSVTKDKHGDFIKTQQTLANQMRIAKASIEQAGANIATGFLPYLNKLLLMFNSGGLKSIGSVFSGIGNTIISIANSAKTPVQSLANSLGNLGQTSGLKTLFSGIDSKPLETLKYTINSVIYGVRDLVNFVSNHMIATKTILAGFAGSFAATKIVTEGLKIQKTIKDISKGIEGLKGLSKAGKLLESIFGLPPQAVIVIAAIAAVAAGAYLIINHWTLVKQFIDNFFNSVQGKFLTATVGILGITKATKALGLTFTDLKLTGLYAADAVKKIGLGIGTGFSKAGLLAKTLGSSLLGIGKSALSATKDIAVMTAGIVKQGALWAANAIKAGIYKTATLAVAAAERITAIAQAALNFVMNLNPITLIITAVVGLVAALVVLYNKNLWFKNGINAIWVSIKTFFSGIGTWIVNTFNTVVNWFATLPIRLYTSAVNMFTSFKAGAGSIVNTIGAWISDKFSAFVNFFKNLPSTALQWGKDIVDQLKAGIEAKVSDVVKTAEDLGEKILDGIKNIFGIHSPSKVMFSIGGYLIQGLTNAILKGKGSLTSVISKVFGGAMDFAHGIFSGGDVSSWLSTALALTGTDQGWLSGLLKLTSYESGDPGTLGTGSASMVNGQSVGGEYATGLLQMLPSTFREFSTGLGGITNPIANAAAAIKYIKSRYGSVYNTPLFTSGGKYNGYKFGTSSANKGPAEIAEDGMELVVGRQVRSLNGEQVINNRETKGLLGGKSINMTNNFYFTGNVGNEEFFEEAGSYITTKIRTTLANT